MRFRKLSDKYEFDAMFYLVILGLAALIVGVPWYAKRMYDRSRGAEIQALLHQENLNSIEAYRKQAKTWVSSRIHGVKLTADERDKAEEIMAQGLYNWMKLWTDGRMNSVSKAEIDRQQKVMMEATFAKVDGYLESIGKKPR